MAEVYDSGGGDEIEPHETSEISGEDDRPYDDMDEHLVCEDGNDTSDLSDDAPPPDRHELDEADTSALVERKLPNSRLFRTERYDRIDDPDQRAAHLAARRLAGEPAEYQPYSVTEHHALMELLASIDPELTPPEPVDDFDGTFMQPNRTNPHRMQQPGTS